MYSPSQVGHSPSGAAERHSNFRKSVTQVVITQKTHVAGNRSVRLAPSPVFEPTYHTPCCIKDCVLACRPGFVKRNLLLRSDRVCPLSRCVARSRCGDMVRGGAWGTPERPSQPRRASGTWAKQHRHSDGILYSVRPSAPNRSLRRTLRSLRDSADKECSPQPKIVPSRSFLARFSVPEATLQGRHSG